MLASPSGLFAEWMIFVKGLGETEVGIAKIEMSEADTDFFNDFTAFVVEAMVSR